MCGRYTLRDPRRAKFDRQPVGGLFELAPRYNIAPSQNVLAITERNGEREASFYQWGLVPAWSSDYSGLGGFINARAETLQEKPSFSESFQRRRCLIPADGFYEWKRTGKSKQPYYFQLKYEAPFAFAGIWDQWQGAGRVIVSCAIITTTANELLFSVHDRMPVILSPSSQRTWLSTEATPAELTALLTPFPAEQMKAHPVSDEVNHATIENERLVERCESGQLAQPALF
jgi:putative SOS response-associated peptidase YedK